LREAATGTFPVGADLHAFVLMSLDGSFEQE
jgi:hypothetical protein